MKLRNVLTKTLWAVLSASIVLGTSVPVYGTNYTSMEEYIEATNEQWEAIGFSNDNGGGSSALQSQQTSNESSVNQTSNAGAIKKTCDHVYETRIISEPTCAEPGIMESKCSKCGDTYKTEIPATGKHEYTSEITKGATCTETGEMTYTCTVCGDSYTEEIPAKGHSYVSSVTKEATCTEAGITTFTCSGCGDSYTEEIPAFGHTEVEEVTKTAGMFTSGEKVIKCSTCGEILSTEVLPGRYPLSVLLIALGILFVAVGAASVIFKKMKKEMNNTTSAA